MVDLGSMISNTVMRVIVAVVFVTVGFALGPLVTTAIATANFTGVAMSAVLTIIVEYVDFIYYIGLIAAALGMVLIGRSD